MSLSTREEVILRELRTMVDFALWTPLQDERVAGAPLEAVAKLLDEPSAELDSDGKTEIVRDRRNWAEAVLAVIAPLLEKAAPPAALARVLAKLAQQHPRSQLVPMLSPAITRCLKHTVDFGKSPDMRKLLQVRRLTSLMLLCLIIASSRERERSSAPVLSIYRNYTRKEKALTILISWAIYNEPKNETKKMCSYAIAYV